MRIAIVGAGLAGSALAILLRRDGAEVTLFDDGRRPELIVGESLVPAVVPLLARLGVEAETAAFSQVKPGVSFVWSPSERFSFTFARFAPAVPPYAYNVPRPRFDDTIRDAAVAAGADRVVGPARLARGAGGAELALAPETLAAAPRLGGRQPDLIVDATGRARLGARALGIKARLGPRSDVAHFAHFDGVTWDDEPGQVVIVRLAAGWSWCIPLRDRLSVGIVVPRDAVARLGATPAERLERAITLDPSLKSIAGSARRVSDVATYANYQLVSERGHGRGWVMVGDAFGFVDPMLSPGVFVALHSAELTAQHLAPLLRRGAVPSPAEIASALAPYAVTQAALLDAWTELIAYFYDGRMAALFRAGREWVGAGGRFRTRAQDHIERHVALQASGVNVRSAYGRGLLRLLGRHGLRGVDPAALAIR